MADLRARRHRETRLALVDAAFELFARHGFVAVTMEQIARAAGVSRSTAYRRFPTKEDIVLDLPRQWLTAFDEAVSSLPSDTTLAEATRAACLAVATRIDAERETVLAAYAILAEVPGLRSSGMADSAWLNRMMDLIEHFGRLEPAAAAVVAGAYVGATDAMMQAWADAGGSPSVTEQTEHLLDRLQPILT